MNNIIKKFLSLYYIISFHLLCISCQTSMGNQATSESQIYLCTPPTQKEILNKAKKILAVDPQNKLHQTELWQNLKNEVKLFKTKLDNSSNQYYFALCQSAITPPGFNAKSASIILKLRCISPQTGWEIDWYLPGYQIRKESIQDIDGDGIQELELKNAYIGQGIHGENFMIYSFIDSEPKIIYQYQALDRLQAVEVFKPELNVGDTIIKSYKVSYEDVDQDGLREIVEQATFKLFEAYENEEAHNKLKMKILDKKNIYTKINDHFILKTK